MKYNNSEIVCKKIDNIEYLQFKALLEYNEDIIHFFTLRHGGGSKGDFNSLNLGLFTNDDVNIVKQNYNNVLSKFNIDINNVFIPKQIHSDKIIFVNENDEGSLYNNKYIECDGQITNAKNKMLASFSADCMTVLIYDKKKKYISNIHSRLERCNK